MSRARAMPGVLGIFEHLDSMMEALQVARLERIEIRDVYSPVPVPEAVEFVRPGRSPVRYATFVGGITGCLGGLALSLYTSGIWNLVVGGKPVTATVPFFVVAFELTILLGAGATLLALLFFSRLPFRGFPGSAHRPEFSEDRFGVWLACNEDNRERVETLLTDAGAERVEFVVKRGAPLPEVAS